MVKERLSKLQKWILLRCYEKTINEDRSNLTLLQSWNYKYSIKPEEHKDHEIYWKYLFRAEILLDYFKCEPDKYKFCSNRHQHFKGKNNKEQVILTNSLSNLEKKGLINILVGTYFRWFGITLTDKGKELVLLLTPRQYNLKVNDKENQIIFKEVVIEPT